ncbi:MAG: hypothetical protein KGL35_29230 [Bradyrhizobium sp.]|nr:hypothetical protein [Bradyrhizobium sp.]
MTLIAEVDNACAQLMGAYRDLEQLAITVRSNGHEVRLICPAGCESQLARLLYTAPKQTH